MRFLIIALIGILGFVVEAGAQSHEFNRLIVQMEYKQSIEDGLTEANENLPQANFSIHQSLSKSLNIWLVSYDEQSVPSEKAIDALEDADEIALAQVNHTSINNRLAPDDTLYSSQWCHYQSSDADMDSEDAWDVTTGGVTSMGDTIVVAVVDGGADLDHEDLDYWTNYHEIPGNGIDDDNNGYVDDANGWHVYYNSGNVYEDEDVNMSGFWDDHGIHVSGIIGAKGNNGIGVAGVNWNVKVMAVKGSSTYESVLLKSYGYVYDQRMIYNRSEGDSGAYVVATNSSFGEDYGDPNDFPIWCGLYDSLGSVGILSAVAGPNLGINIDVDGDVPGACPSNYTISTTNSRDTDNRNNGAGYGEINCDIAAPGTDINSTIADDDYGYKTGTSMATPQVAGAVALMYSAACEEMFVNLDDAQFALQMRDYMLNQGFDSIASMDGESVTGGRLNLHKCITAVQSYNCVIDTSGSGIGISESRFGNSFTLYPNPANEVLTVRSSSVMSTISIVNVLGETIIVEPVNSETYELNTASLNNGVYFVAVLTEGGEEAVQKVVIQH